ncbi:hypothetical protein FO519_002803 [Halicephalobus sp. NKZ332]|nr:hypothetical protein FO519_002803 [Halicephalobus sp. NKZ332]
MKFLIFSIFVFLGSLLMIEAQANYNEDLASKLVYFAAATFVGPTDKDGDDLTNQCFTKAFPDGTWTQNYRYSVKCQLDHPDDTCQGLIASNPDKKIVIIAFRGTVGGKQLIHEIADAFKGKTAVSFTNNVPLGNAYQYFYNSMDAMWFKFYFTGHSLGGAIAALSALRARVQVGIPDNRLQLYTYGEPRVGDYQLSESFKAYISRKFRVVHYRDPVPHMPFCKDGNNETPCKQTDTSPYHHPQEIWYNNQDQTMNVGKNDYKICNSTNGEDGHCSDSISDWSFVLDTLDTKGSDFHNHYFNHRLDEWGPKGCNSSSFIKISASLLILSILAKFIF